MWYVIVTNNFSLTLSVDQEVSLDPSIISAIFLRWLAFDGGKGKDGVKEDDWTVVCNVTIIYPSIISSWDGSIQPHWNLNQSKTP